MLTNMQMQMCAMRASKKEKGDIACPGYVSENGI